MSRLRYAPAVLSAILAVVVAALGVPYAGGVLTGSVTNTTNTVRSSIRTSCTATTADTPAYLVYPLNETTGATTASDVSGNARHGSYQNTSGITYRVPGPCPRNGAVGVTLDGATGYVTGAQSVSAPPVFPIEIWFKTTTIRGGKLVGLGNAATGASSNYDRHVYMIDSGQLSFGIWPGVNKVITSPASYNNGSWHQAVATLAPSGAQVGQRLYVDGVLVASDPASTVAQDFGVGWWRVGYDNLNYWDSRPTSDYFAGSLAWASVYSSALTPSEVSAHYYAGV